MPALVQPLRAALNTRQPAVLRAALAALTAVVVAGDAAGAGGDGARALAPHLGLLLPVLALYFGERRSRAGAGARGAPACLGQAVAELLTLIHRRGGDDARRAVKRVVPAFDCV